PGASALPPAELAQLDANTVPNSVLTALAEDVDALVGPVTVAFDPAPLFPVAGAPRTLMLSNTSRRWIGERHGGSITVTGIFPAGNASATRSVPTASIAAVLQGLQARKVHPALQTLGRPEPPPPGSLP